MKYSLFAVAFCLLSASIAFSQSGEINIIPRPQYADEGTGSFNLNRQTKIVVSSLSRRNGEILNDHLQSRYGLRLQITDKYHGPNSIILAQRPPNHRPERPPSDSYGLFIDKRSIQILGDIEGQFYGLQSLIQLLPNGLGKSVVVPAIRISDSPRFKYRGMHLDVSRHFMPVSFVKRYIDLLAQYKFNQFHWHLTDDQGWRIEIKKYPKLTEIGSKRSESHEGVYSTVFKGDGRPVEGFYTQAEIRDVVAYAKARYINVIPEIELPGHASAALAAYPELGIGCAARDYKFEVKKTWGIFKEVFCPTDETFKFLEDVLDETIKLFPDSPYIHIGGDEVLKDFWKESKFVQDLMKRENLKDEHEVQSYFVRRIEKFVNSKGKKIIGWDEILEGGVAPNATIMSWRGMKGGIEAAKAKHDVIMTPTDYSYFDYGQGNPAFEPLNIGGYLPLEKVYSFEPVPKELTADDAKYILGGQANIWTEYLETPAAVEYMAFPRLLALSEVLWSQAKDRNFKDFTRRLSEHYPRLDSQKVNYRIPEPYGLENAVVGKEGTYFTILRPTIEGSSIHVSVDGSTPKITGRGEMHHAQISFDLAEGETKEIKAIVVLPNGRKSSVFSATIVRGAMLEPVTIAETKPGVNYSLVVPSAQFAQDPPAKTGETRSILLTQFEKQIDLKKSFGVAFEGYLKIAQDGVYELQIDSTWDASLDLGGKRVIDEAGTKDRSMKSVVVPLKAGLHKIALRYDHREGDAHFRFRVGLKGQGLRQIGGGELVH
ncbi:MAG: family 20 glycosylhydrolase [Pyrinomonadaceae bacterium]